MWCLSGVDEDLLSYINICNGSIVVVYIILLFMQTLLLQQSEITFCVYFSFF